MMLTSIKVQMNNFWGNLHVFFTLPTKINIILKEFLGVPSSHAFFMGCVSDFSSLGVQISGLACVCGNCESGPADLTSNHDFLYTYFGPRLPPINMPISKKKY